MCFCLYSNQNQKRIFILRQNKNDKGAALVYVLIAFVFVGAVGSLVLTMSNKEKADTGLRVSSEMARFAATSGLNHSLNLFTDPTPAISNATLALLNRFFAGEDITDEDRYIVGSPTTYVELDRARVRVRIIGIDLTGLRNIVDENGVLKEGRQLKESPIRIMFRSESIDNSGSRAENIGAYEILGYASNQTNNDVPENALFFGDSGFRIYHPVEINGGAAYIGGRTGGQPISVQATGSVFRGNFFLESNSTAGAFAAFDNAVFHRPAFFGLWTGNTETFWAGSGAVRFREGFGAEMRHNGNQTMDFRVSGGNVHLLDGFHSVGGINFLGTGQTLFHRLAENSTEFWQNHLTGINNVKTSTAGTITSNTIMTRASILTALGIRPNKRPVSVNLSGLTPSATTLPLPANLNTLSNVAGKNFAYVRIPAGTTAETITSSAPFSGNLILELQDGSITLNFDCTSTGNVLVYVPKNSTGSHTLTSPTAPAAPTAPTDAVPFPPATPMGAAFRGFVVNNGRGFYVLNAKVNGSLYGINDPYDEQSYIQFVAGANRSRIDFDRRVLEYWVDEGIVSFGADPDIPPPPGGTLPVVRVEQPAPAPANTFYPVSTRLLSRSF